jgi:hypothetical protein
MEIVLENLAGRIEFELGLIAHCVTVNNSEKIVGAAEYDDRGGVSLYIKKFEVLVFDGQYRLRLPIGQTFIEKSCATENEIIDSILNHYCEYHPNVKLKHICKD